MPSSQDANNSSHGNVYNNPQQMPVRYNPSPNAKLAKGLRNLTEFWEEYVFGIGDNKPAKDFDKDDRNGQTKPFKTQYTSGRNKIWRLQAYLVNVGYTPEAANARIVEVYGTATPTLIITIIEREQKNPNFPFIGKQRFNPRFIVNTN